MSKWFSDYPDPLAQDSPGLGGARGFCDQPAAAPYARLTSLFGVGRIPQCMVREGGSRAGFEKHRLIYFGIL